MRYELATRAISELESDIVVIGIFKGEQASEVLETLNLELSKNMLEHIETHLELENFKGNDQQLVSLPAYGQVKAGAIYLFGLGKHDEYGPDKSRALTATLARKLKDAKTSRALAILLRSHPIDSGKKKKKGKSTKEKALKAGESKEMQSDAQAQHLRAMVEGFGLGAFEFDKYKTVRDNTSGKTNRKNDDEGVLSFAGLSLTNAEFEKETKLGHILAEATNFARMLIAEPADYMTPTKLSQEAKNLAKDSALTCKVLNKEQIEKLGMGSFLGVARGADQPLKLIVLKYSAPGAKKTIGLVGKGITFDSGGLSLKPAASMERMKYDMSGAAAVLGTMKAVAQIEPAVSVIAVIAATENMPNGSALHPGDVLVSMKGKTIEVNNTDAEGRLVLADALTYIQEQGIDEVIDVATLTGAVVQALGRVAAGIMGNDDELIARIMESGKHAGERFWQLPLFDEYKSSLKSDIADLKNAGSRGEAGSSCAGMFLKEFIDDTAWAHMDIAGVAWSEKTKGEIGKGATGFGVRTLTNFILAGGKSPK